MGRMKERKKFARHFLLVVLMGTERSKGEEKSKQKERKRSSEGH
jgi:hypothetical protein